MLSLSLLSLAFLLTPALAIGPSQPEHKVPPKVAPTKFENFTWADPFSSSKIGQFDVACESSRKFTAHEYQIHDLHDPEPIGLAPYGEALKSIFGGRPYPGGWDGMDPHGYERTLVKMAYETVPVRVKEWIAEQETTRGPGKGLFAVYDKPDKVDQEVSTTADLGESGDDRSLDEKRVVIFAPGAIYDTLPLWVAEDSKCEGTSIYLLNSSSPTYEWERYNVQLPLLTTRTHT